jgi:N-acyl-D-amino-acid deacylase
VYNLLLKNGKIMDGTGNPWYRADVGIKDGKIMKIGTISEGEADKVIDVHGLVVSPGFIDIHTHADFILPLKNHVDILEGFVKQGITTLVVGNCGLSPAPVNPDNVELLKDYTAFFQGGELEWDWPTMGDFFDSLQKSGVFFNVIPMVSHGAVRIAVMGFQEGEPNKQQMEQMKQLVKQAMEDGSFGLSAGLIYAPGMYASTDELIEVTKPLIPYRGIFTCHVRGSSETIVNATKEIIEIARTNGIPVEHSHIETFGEPNWKYTNEILRLHEGAREEGLDITFDVIPYVAANTTLTACFPSYAFEGGIDKFIERLKNPTERARIKYDVENMSSDWPTWRPGTWPHNLARATGWKNIYLIWVPGEDNAKYIGKSFEEIGGLMGISPFDAAAEILIQERGAGLALYFGTNGDLSTDEYLKKLLAHQNAAINTDAILTGRGMPHPASYGSFPRVLGQYTREQKIMSPEQAVRKMTSISAQRFNIHDRGLVKLGMWADITVFDENTIRDNATYLEPDKFPDGIEYVIINGNIVLEKGSVNKNILAGQVLRRA